MFKLILSFVVISFLTGAKPVNKVALSEPSNYQYELIPERLDLLTEKLNEASDKLQKRNDETTYKR